MTGRPTYHQMMNETRRQSYSYYQIGSAIKEANKAGRQPEERKQGYEKQINKDR